MLRPVPLGTQADDVGLICGFRLGPVEACGLADVGTGKSNRATWIHLNVADGRARRWLQDESGLDAAAVKVLTEGEPRIHLERRGPALVAVLGDLHHDFDRDAEGLGTIRIYVDEHRIITARRARLRTVDKLRRDLSDGTATANSPGALFESFIERLVNTFSEVVATLAETTDDLEDRVLAGRTAIPGTLLGQTRRNMARLRRHVNANRAALSGLRVSLPDVLSVETSQLRQILERLDTTVADLELVQERTRLLQEEIVSRVGETTSRNLAVLSTVTTALLPITLLTGIFGMNVGGLPWVGDPSGFRWVMLGIAATVSVSLVLLLRRRER